MSIKLNPNQLNKIAPLLVMLLGLSVLAGWIFNSQSLVRVLPTFRPMVVATAFCFLLAGINLLADSYTQRYVNIIRSLTSYMVLIISLLVISAYLFDTTAFIDFPVFHRKLIDDDLRPGLMGANTAVCFLMTSLAFIVLMKQPMSMLKARIVKLLAACVFLVGFIGFFGYVFNIRALYGWAGAARMAVHTAVGMMLLGIGLYIKVSNQLQFLNESSEEEETITTVIFFTLFLSSLSIAVVAFGFLQDKTIDFVKQSYIQQVEQRTLFFDQIIYHRSKRATTFLGNVLLAGAAKNILENNLISTKDALDISALAKENEFSAIYVLQGNDRKIPIFVGTIATPAISIDLKGEDVRHLIWDKGYVLQSIFDIPSFDDAKIVFEQPLTVLDQMDKKNRIQSEESENQHICGNDSIGIACFPDRFHQRPFYISNHFQDIERPVSMALKNKTGVVRFYDEEKYQTISAYKPIGDLGLGLSLAVSVNELYSPIISSFIFTMLFTMLILFLSYWVIKSKANPLIEKISIARKTAEIEKNRFIAATEGGLDSFYILEAIRDAQQQIVDFRFIFVNTSASKLMKKKTDEMQGKLLFEVLPFMKQKKYLSRFKYVIETGQTIAEELKIDEGDMNATWLYWQIVKLDDGFSITSRDITDRHDMLESLEASREHVQQILTNQNVATFIIDAHHRVTHWNLACEKLTGVLASNMIGSNASWQAFYDSPRPCLADLVLDNQKNKAAEYYDKQGQSTLLESGWHAEAWFENLGGKRRYAIFDAAPIFDGKGNIVAVIETLQDVTESKLVEQALDVEKQNLDAVLEGTNAGTWQWNVITDELKVNARWADMLGYQANELGDKLTEAWYRRIHPDDIEMVKACKQKHLTGETAQFDVEFRMRHRTGHWVWIASRGRIMTKIKNGNPEWMFGTHLDISVRKEIDLELRQAYANLEEFTAVASHDLKSPLRGIADLMEWIEEDLGDNISDDVKNNLNRVQVRVKRMSTLIDDLLAYSRAGMVHEANDVLNINEMLEEIVELQHIPDTFTVQIDCQIKSIKTSETPLKTIVRNLISNAIKHHDKETGHIDIQVTTKNEFYVFEIKDDGPGIAKESHQRIFKLFQTLSKHEGSTGVGLAVSKRMAEVHGGYLELESDIEKRVTIFRLLWPRVD